MSQLQQPIAVERKRSRSRCLIYFLMLVGLIMVLVCAVLAILPYEADAEIPEAEWGAGAVNIQPSWTGLLRPWPESKAEINPEIANLGYQLFFDPILSGDNALSCAHCHHPDLGFSDGRDISVNNQGNTDNRHAPTLWNVAYNGSFFWDGRANSLEEQMKVALSSPNEMDQNLDDLVAELETVEVYKDQFEALFENGLTLDNVLVAIASFERTLISDGSAFDEYANGNQEALNSQQRRGLGIFRSAATRCFECHSLPTFNDDSFRITGVPNPNEDKGRDVYDGEGMNYAFKVPTLRNVALSGPYMHNGHFDTLEKVIDFYRNGGGAADNFDANIDRVVTPGFKVSEQEKADLIAFLYALTDETIPESYWKLVDYVDDTGHILIPETVPSGLTAVVQVVENPARDLVASVAADPEEKPSCHRDEVNQTVTVKGESIQSAVDCAKSGDTILVPPGIYHERVLIDINDITLRGIVDTEPSMCPVQNENAVFPSGDAAPKWPILDGDIDGDGVKDLTDGVIASGNDFSMEYFIVRNYTGNGVLVEGVHNVSLRHLYTEDTGLYGVYPVRSTNVLVECNITTLATDAGIYVGQSRQIIVRNNLAYDGVTGIEIENSVDADVYENETWNNTGGILIFLLPNLHSRVSQDIRVYDNYVHDNNRPKNDATPGSVVGKVPVGTGILVMASDNTEIYNNRIEDNNSYGIGITSLYQAYEPSEIGDVGPLSENNYIHNNIYRNNGADPDQEVKDAGLPGADLLWDTRGFGNAWDEPDASRFPPLLPAPNWVGVGERIYFQIVNFVGKRF